MRAATGLARGAGSDWPAWGWALAAAAAVAVWWAPSSGICDALLAGSGVAALAFRRERLAAAWGRPAGWFFGALALWTLLGAAWSVHPAGTLRDAAKCIPLWLGAAGLPAWLGGARELRRALWLGAGAVTARLALDLACLAASRGVPGVLAEARFAPDFLWTHPNVCSMMACLAAMVWLGLLPRARGGWGRWGSLAAAGACGAYLVALGSRGPQAVFAGTVLLWPAAWLPGWKAKAAALLAAAALGWGAWSAAGVVNPRFREAKTMSGANRRGDIWRHSWMLAKRRPAVGWGYGKKAFERLIYDNPEQRAPDVPVRFPHAHSHWLMLAVQGGAVGFGLAAAAWVSLWGGLARAARRAGRRAAAGSAEGGGGRRGAWRAAMAARAVPVLLLMMSLLVAAYGVADYPDSTVRVAMWLLAGAGAACLAEEEARR